jgi:hypothetical protein
MKKTLLLIVLAAVASFTATFARADSYINFTDQFGTANIIDAGIFSHGVQLTGYAGVHSKPNHALGSVTFDVGPLLTGSIFGGGTFSSAGSVFDITGDVLPQLEMERAFVR